MDTPHFLADHNVGALGRRLRMLGFDTILFGTGDDGDMVRRALDEGRTILTRDTHIMERRVVTSGRLKAVLLTTDRPQEQLCRVIKQLELKNRFNPFTRCIEDNHLLVPRLPAEVVERVPPYVAKTQTQFMECPQCRRIYWRGTHWQAMMDSLANLEKC